MANEITANISTRATKNGATVDFRSNNRITMAGNEMVSLTQSVGTTSEVLLLGELVTAPGVLAIKNLDSTNYIEIGGDSGLTVFKLKLLPGQFCQFQPTSATIYVKANTAAVRIQVVALEL